MSACSSPPASVQDSWAAPVTPAAVKSGSTAVRAVAVEPSHRLPTTWLGVSEVLADQDFPPAPQGWAPSGSGIRQEVIRPVHATCWVPGAVGAGSAGAGGAVRSEASSVPAQVSRSCASNVFGLEYATSSTM